MTTLLGAWVLAFLPATSNTNRSGGGKLVLQFSAIKSTSVPPVLPDQSEMVTLCTDCLDQVQQEFCKHQLQRCDVNLGQNSAITTLQAD